MIFTRNASVRRSIVRLYIVGSIALAAVVGMWIPVAGLPRPHGGALIAHTLRDQRAGVMRYVPRYMPRYAPPGPVDPGMPRVAPDSGPSERVTPVGPQATRYVPSGETAARLPDDR